jgi:hypothetical protein
VYSLPHLEGLMGLTDSQSHNAVVTKTELIKLKRKEKYKKKRQKENKRKDQTENGKKSQHHLTVVIMVSFGTIQHEE